MFKHMRSQWDHLMVWSWASPLRGGSSLYNLLARGEHISVLHMKNEIQTWPKLGAFGHLAGFLLFFFASVFLNSSFLCEQSPSWALSANIWASGYFTCSNMFCLFLKECENTPVRIKSNNQGQPIQRWKSLGSELHLWASLCHSCLSKQINQPTLMLFYSATTPQLHSHAAFT